MEFFVIFDYIGVAAFAITGVLKGLRHKLDVFGLLVLATFTALGGGLIRDAIFGIHPPKAFLDNGYWIIIIAACVAALLLAHKFEKSRGKTRFTLDMADAIGLAAFTFIGCSVAKSLGVGAVGMVFAGVLTAVGGGVIRDLLVREIPAVLHESVYASAALAGAICFCLMIQFMPATPTLTVALITFTITFSIRMCAIIFGWHLPKLNSKS
ncbi:MAG: trimeric intracellular cation channel family protein [Alphaproteobacteria bacterium]|nr:trimeric intracellular cation channel family protein [Alphaproteobacteria bacterium]